MSVGREREGARDGVNVNQPVDEGRLGWDVLVGRLPGGIMVPGSLVDGSRTDWAVHSEA